MTPLQLFLISIVLTYIFDAFTDEKKFEEINNKNVKMILIIMFILSVGSIFTSIIWAIFYYVKI